jgi:hypothetical protein
VLQRPVRRRVQPGAKPRERPKRLLAPSRAAPGRHPFITREVETNRPGFEVVLLRMAYVIFIQILRAYLARVPDDGGGFLGALRDPSTAAALGAMHHRAVDRGLARQGGRPLALGLRGALHTARRRATPRLPDASPNAEGGDTAARGRNARKSLAPNELRVGGLVQPRAPPVGRRRARCLP